MQDNTTSNEMSVNNFVRLSAEKYNAPQPIENPKGSKPYVTWGSDNNFGETLQNLVDISTIHSACIHKKLEFSKGKSVTVLSSTNQSFFDVINSQGESFVDIYNKLCYDKLVFNEYYLLITYNAKGKPAKIEHLDYSTVRKGKKDEFGNIKRYYVCQDWGNVRSNKINEFAAFNLDTAVKDKQQIFLCTEYAPNKKYYVKPDYFAAIGYIYLDFEISNFHLSNIKNGYFPSLFINVNRDIDDPEKRDEIAQELDDQFKGSKEAGEVVITFSKDGTTIDAVQSSANHEMFLVLNDTTQQYILSAHRITSPQLLGIKTAGQLGGTQELQNATELFLNTVIIPFQESVLNPLYKLFKMFEYDLTVNITQVQTVTTDIQNQNQ